MTQKPSVPTDVSQSFDDIHAALQAHSDIGTVDRIEAPNDTFLPGGYIPIRSSNRWGFKQGYVMIFNVQTTTDLCESSDKSKEDALAFELENYIRRRQIGQVGIAIEKLGGESMNGTIWPKLAIYYPSKDV